MTLSCLVRNKGRVLNVSKYLNRLMSRQPCIHLATRYSTESSTGDSTEIGFQIGKQYHYTRQVIEANKVLYTIPGGVHYEAFDHAGMIYPWSHLELVDSVYADANFVEMHKLLQENYEFYVTLSLDVEKDFYDINTPKYPIHILYELAYIGNSSFKNTSILKHPDRERSYATCSVQSVLVRKETGKPVLLPDWWRNKYKPYCKNGTALKLEHPICPEHINVSASFPLTVYNSHCDWNNHTHYTSYTMFCYNAYVDGVNKQRYDHVTKDTLDSGIKSLIVSFKQESSRGDKLIVESWENEQQPKCLHFEVKKNGAICCQTMIKFY